MITSSKQSEDSAQTMVTKAEEVDGANLLRAQHTSSPSNSIVANNVTVSIAAPITQLHPIAPAGAVPVSSPSSVVSSTTANSSSGVVREIHHASNYYREWILEAIDKLRERKARPDAERITTLMKRYHNIPFADTQRCLDKLADMGQVVCVDYKGNISYRNPRRWRKCGSTCVLNPPSISKVILDVVAGLLNEKRQRSIASSGTTDTGGAQFHPPPTLEYSFTAQELEGQLMARNVPQLANGSLKFETVLERECTYGCLARRADGRLILDENRERKRVLIASKKFYRPPIASTDPIPHQQNSQKNVRPNLSSNHSCAITPETMSYASGGPCSTSQPVRTTYSAIQPAPYPKGSKQQLFANTGGNRPIASKPPMKHPNSDACKVMPRIEPKVARGQQPSDGSTVTSQWSSPSVSTVSDANTTVSSGNQAPPTLPIQANVCSECGGISSTSKKLYGCSDCRVKAHLSCLGFWVHDPMEPATWQCPKCISCCLCRNRQSLDRLMVCATCSQAYHSQCHKPKITEQVEDFKPWVCQPCNDKGIYFIEPPDESMSDASCMSPSPDKKYESNKEAAGVKPTPALLEYMPVNSKMSQSSGMFGGEVQSVSSTTAATKNDVTKEHLTEADVQAWGMEDVAAWLSHMGFSKESLLFLENEIDGPSLLLMKSIEIILQTGVKLGPAMKIHEKLKKILTSSKASTWK